MKKIVLASTSVYRKKQLEVLGIPFQCQKPVFDEELHKEKIANEYQDPRLIASRLSFEKGKSISHSDAITISGDQLIAFKGEILGKPGNRDNAIAQLSRLQNEMHELITACHVFNGTDECFSILDVTQIKLKPLSISQIEFYVDLDQAWDCAGSYKIELHAIQIIESIVTQDFTAIQGLPLISLAKTLGSINITIPFLGEKNG